MSIVLLCRHSVETLPNRLKWYVPQPRDSSELTCTVAILQNQVVDQTIHADLRAISERERYLSEYIKKLERNEVLSHDKYNEL